MARTGRPPKPLEVKRALCNPGKRPLPPRSKTVALEPATSTPPVPIALQEPGRAAWQRIWSAGERWLSPGVDWITVETVCSLVDEVTTYRSLIRRAGPLLKEPIVTPAGMVVGDKIVANPAVLLLRKAESQLEKELSSLGFNPTARSRLGLAEVKRVSIIEQFHSQRTGTDDILDAEEVIDIAPDA